MYHGLKNFLKDFNIFFISNWINSLVILLLSIHWITSPPPFLRWNCKKNIGFSELYTVCEQLPFSSEWLIGEKKALTSFWLPTGSVGNKVNCVKYYTHFQKREQIEKKHNKLLAFNGLTSKSYIFFQSFVWGILLNFTNLFQPFFPNVSHPLIVEIMRCLCYRQVLINDNNNKQKRLNNSQMPISKNNQMSMLYNR